MLTVLLAFLFFTGIIVALVCALLVARRLLVDVGPVDIDIEGARTLTVAGGRTLLAALADEGVFVPSACGGKGTCGACRVRVLAGGGPAPASELAVVGRGDARRGFRLACQLKVRQNLRIVLPEELLGVRRWRCRVRSNRNVATFIKELVLEPPAGAHLGDRAGGFVMIECPPYDLRFDAIDVDARFAAAWQRLGVNRLRAGTDAATERAYSMANYPGETEIILNVRIALPPLDAPDAPPGVVSSFLFSLRPGDVVTVSGPYGRFHALDSDREMCLIGGGAGMAPLRAHILDQLLRLKSSRKITYWYGARSLGEAFYVDELDRLQREHANFEWHLALSEPLPSDEWRGATGFIHQVLYDDYLRHHPRPEDVEYYICGPPAMLAACRKMLDDLGVPPENVLFDDFAA